MGASLGGSYASTNSSSKSQSQQANTYTPGQSGLQDLLAKAFSILVPSTASGGISPNVQAVQTAGADQINKTSSGLGDRMQRFLAQRGFGSSGTAGKTALAGELGRQSNLAANASAASGLQLQQNNSYLSDALQFAFNQIGQTGSESGSGSSSGYKVGGGVSFPL